MFDDYLVCTDIKKRDFEKMCGFRLKDGELVECDELILSNSKGVRKCVYK